MAQGITLTEVWLDPSSTTPPPQGQPWDAFVWVNIHINGIPIQYGFPLMPPGTDPVALVRDRIAEMRSLNHPVSHALLVHVGERCAAMAGDSAPNPAGTKGAIVWTKRPLPPGWL